MSVDLSLLKCNLLTSSSNRLGRISSKVQNEYSSTAITMNDSYYISGPLNKDGPLSRIASPTHRLIPRFTALAL